MINARDIRFAHFGSDSAAPIDDTRLTDWYTLPRVHGAFARWLGNEYDLGALNAVLAAAAVERLNGDPLWLLLLSGPGNAKSETVQALAGAGAMVVSTISSEGALLSGSAKKDTAKDATGGLLRELGDSGVIVLKDVTSILSMHRDARASVLAAIREIYDGRYVRKVGTDGARSLAWTGRITVIGAVTTAWDRAHDVIASMGDRFVIVRMDSNLGRMAAGRHAIGNTGREVEMRQHLAEAVGGLLARVNPHDPIAPTTAETEAILAAANVVALCRTGVDFDYRGDVIDAHQPEAPTRLAKQLTQVLRGGVALGIERQEALHLALRCARDSMPPLRLAILEDVAANPGARAGDVRRRLDKPWTTVDRQLQALHVLGVLSCNEITEPHREKAIWSYHVADHIDVAAITASPDLSSYHNEKTEEEIVVTDKSGDAQEVIDARSF